MRSKNQAIHNKTPSNILIGDILNHLMRKNHVDAHLLSHHTGIPIPTINRLRNNKQCNPTLSTLLPLAHYFGVSMNQLIGDAVSLNNISADVNKEIPIIALDEAEQSIHKRHHAQLIKTTANISEAAFAIKSRFALMMSPFSEESILIFDPNLQPFHRDYVIVRLQNHRQPCIRQLLLDGDDCYFKPLSQEPGEMILSKKHKMIAVMVQALTNYRS